MKKYKLLQYYPSLPDWVKHCDTIEFEKDGLDPYYFAKKDGQEYFVLDSDVENNPDFWELVEEKEYEILVLNSPLRVLKSGCYTQEFLNEQASKIGFSIHSIKRLSDGEIFTVGDNVAFDLSGNTMVIKSIYISDNELWVSDKDKSQRAGVKLRMIQHTGKPISLIEKMTPHVESIRQSQIRIQELMDAAKKESK